MIGYLGDDLVSRPRPLPVAVAERAKLRPRDPLVARRYLEFNMAQRFQFFDALDGRVVDHGT